MGCSDSTGPLLRCGCDVLLIIVLLQLQLEGGILDHPFNLLFGRILLHLLDNAAFLRHRLLMLGLLLDLRCRVY